MRPDGDKPQRDGATERAGRPNRSTTCRWLEARRCQLADNNGLPLLSLARVTAKTKSKTMLEPRQDNALVTLDSPLTTAVITGSACRRRPSRADLYLIPANARCC